MKTGWLRPTKYVREDPQFMRPAEVDLLIADPSEAREKLGWKPSVDFEQLVKLMIDSAWRCLAKAARTRPPRRAS
jgi:GDPmannose 4,6-dehydratase